MATEFIHLPRIDDNGLDAFAGLRHAYCFGGCGFMARALHAITGWPMVALDTHDGDYTHMGVQAPDGTLWDARGPHKDIASFIAPFTSVVPKDGLRVVTMNRLLRDHPSLAHSLLTKERMAAEMLLDLPHSAASDRERNRAFVDSLERLSRRYNVWVAPHNLREMHTWPVIGETFDGVLGYRAAHTDGVVTFDRMLASEMTRGPRHLPDATSRFLDALYTLSREHGFWIRSVVPMLWPRLCNLRTDALPSAHYVLRQTNNFAGYLLGLG